MSKNAYAVIGWFTVQIAQRVARQKVREYRPVIAAALVLAGVIAAGIAAAAEDE